MADKVQNDHVQTFAWQWQALRDGWAAKGKPVEDEMLEATSLICLYTQHKAFWSEEAGQSSTDSDLTLQDTSVAEGESSPKSRVQMRILSCERCSEI